MLLFISHIVANNYFEEVMVILHNWRKAASKTFISFIELIHPRKKNIFIELMLNFG